MADYTPLSEVSSPHHHHTLDVAAGEFIDLTVPDTLSDSDSVTSPAKHKGYSSTSSYSSLSDSLQDSEADKNATTSNKTASPSQNPPLREGNPQISTEEKKVESPSPSKQKKSDSPKLSEEKKFDSPTTSSKLGITVDTLEELARLRSFVSSRTFSFDSDQSQTHNDKLEPEATKVKKLIDKIRTYALSPE